MNQEHYNKISAYCTSTERCISEVREKMRKLEVSEGEWDEIVERLQTEGFIDEKRYAEAFTKDKFRFAKWGKRKIEYALKAKGISGSYIQTALNDIDDEEYEALKNQLTESKAKTLKGDKNSMENRARILRFLAGRGFTVALLMTLFTPRMMASGYIEGYAKEYAGENLELYYEDNGITHWKVAVDSCTVDTSGYFKLDTDITETRECFIDLGKNRGALYVEPYKNYKVNLPPLSKPTDRELADPYFAPKDLLLSLINPADDDLNLKITAFEDSFYVAFNRAMQEPVSPEKIEAEYMELEYNFGDDNPFFTTYRYASYAVLVNLYEPTQPNTAIDAFFIDSPVAYNNPAYWDAFNILFEQYRDISLLDSNKELRELVILHHVMAGSLSEEWLETIRSEQNMEIAKQIKTIFDSSAISGNTSGTTVVNIDGEALDLKDFDSPQIYIIFASSLSTQSLSDLDFALASNVKWKGKCVAIVIFTDSDPEKVYKLTSGLAGRKYILMASENKEFVKAFNVKRAPAYFRIDINGKMLEAPAPEPVNFIP